jgi:outer membrane protein assembly factor BamA
VRGEEDTKNVHPIINCYTYVVFNKFRFSFLWYLDNKQNNVCPRKGYMVVQLLEALLQARKSRVVSDGGPSSHTMAPGPT